MPAEDSTAAAPPIEERWLPVPGWPEYEVSDQGRVRGVDRILRHGHRRRGRLLKGSPDSSGYPRVALNRDGSATYRHIHGLVLTAFVGPCPDGMECRHLDGNPGNSVLLNLAWGTHVENVADAFRHGTFVFGERHGGSKLCESEVVEIIAARGEPLAITAARHGISKQQASRIQRRERWARLDLAP